MVEEYCYVKIILDMFIRLVVCMFMLILGDVIIFDYYIYCMINIL